MKGNKGITLIALVITIIVLLILAAVSIAMLSGDNSILSNAQRASSDTAVATAKEKATIRMNEVIADYNVEKYAENNATVTTLAAYITANFKTPTDADAGWSVSGTTITITPKTHDNKTVTGSIDTSNGKITWSES